MITEAEHAETVGCGVHRQRVAPPSPVPPPPEESEVYSLDGPKEWGDEPTFPNQLQKGPDYWRLDKVEIKIFDLNKPEELSAYQELLTACNSTTANKSLIEEERKYCEQTGNWKVYTKIQYLKFRKLLKTKDT